MKADPQNLYDLYISNIYVGVADITKHFTKRDGNPPSKSTARNYLNRVREYADSVEENVSESFPWALVPVDWVLKYEKVTVMQLRKIINTKNATTGGNQ
ncbi:hypothetical protein [Culicoidibacter larvae]|uniref:Uncharacterized protein n=1 Tax=Culicoidibacter larvae TaxID=2579976 RepID=A0A5R8Q8B8_9FIRM|nr:hypothetical protein [Culicoidibacter larvae]TLG71406.1 hypothetical protein FEZ08_10960 [Culicoidibacter larvae]